MDILGRPVLFPEHLTPYGTQRSLMFRVIAAAEAGQHALLEAPTGTGKSLALICAALAWQQSEKERQNVSKRSKKQGDDDDVFDGENRRQQAPAAAAPASAASRVGVAPSRKRAAAVVDLTMSPSSPIELKAPLRKRRRELSPIKIELDLDSRSSSVASPTRPGRTLFDDGDHSRRGLSDDSDDGSSADNDESSDFEAAGVERSWMLPTPSPSQPQEEIASPQRPAATASASATSIPKDHKPLSKKRPVIYFGTRTHTQVKQLIRELGKTPYRPRMSVLGSREQGLCANPKVCGPRGPGSHARESMSVECRKVLDTTTGCSYKERNPSTLLRHPALAPGNVWDVEDLAQLGAETESCAYFAARSIAERADIVFCPYNYLVDPAIRDSCNLRLHDNTLVIIDEAHNIDDVSRECASCEFSLKDLTEALEEWNRVCETDFARVVPDVKEVTRFLAGLEQFLIKSSESMKSTGFEQYEDVKKSAQVRGMFAALELRSTEDFVKLQTAFTHVYTNQREQPEQRTSGQAKPKKSWILGRGKTSWKMKASAMQTVESLMYVLNFFFSNNLARSKDYVMVMQKSHGWGQDDWVHSVGFWAMSPAVAFSQVSASVRSVILTSGTLSPMEAWQAELETLFPSRLVAPHVIDTKTQLLVRTLSHAVSSPGERPLALNSSFKTSSSVMYVDALGGVLLQLCMTTPNGVLCFFPSYALMDRCRDRWKITGLLSKLEATKSAVLEEPRRGGRQSASEDNDTFQSTMDRFYAAANSDGGALFMAVCRGKVSEGLDFADANARAVCLIGIPFPQLKDLKVVLKRQYNDEAIAAAKAQSPSSQASTLSGSEWYVLQAWRALNQALGRCIRHRLDYGAIVLLDERFRGAGNQTNLSRWVRDCVRDSRSAEELAQEIRQFFAIERPKPSDPATASSKSPENSSAALVTPFAATYGDTAVYPQRPLGRFPNLNNQQARASDWNSFGPEGLVQASHFENSAVVPTQSSHSKLDDAPPPLEKIESEPPKNQSIARPNRGTSSFGSSLWSPIGHEDAEFKKPHPDMRRSSSGFTTSLSRSGSATPLGGVNRLEDVSPAATGGNVEIAGGPIWTPLGGRSEEASSLDSSLGSDWSSSLYSSGSYLHDLDESVEEGESPLRGEPISTPASESKSGRRRHRPFLDS